MFREPTPLPYWIIAPILQGSGHVWLGVIAWAVIGGLITTTIVHSRNRQWWWSALSGSVIGGAGGILLLAPLWFVLIPMLDRRCTECGTFSRPGAAVCKNCGHRFSESMWQEQFAEIMNHIARVVITLEMALLVSALILELSDKDPLDTFRTLFGDALGTPRKRADSLLAATPIIFTGLGTAIAFRAGIFNVGVEGSLYMGALAAAWVGFTFVQLPSLLLVMLALAAAAVAGGIWGFIPGYLKARLRVDEVVTTIMFNYIAIEFTSYMVQSGPMFLPGMANAQSETISPKAELPRLVDRSAFNASFIIALVCVVIMLVLMQRLRLGYETRMVGDNPLFARWSGIPVAATILQVMFISGLLGGLAGAGEVLGRHHNFKARFSPGFGFDGLTMALLARNSPVGVLVGALLFGVLRSGATTIELFTDVPIDLVDVIQALIIFFVAIDLSLDWLARRRQIKTEQETQDSTATAS
jgi:general nucleoside transport system permease protein